MSARKISRAIRLWIISACYALARRCGDVPDICEFDHVSFINCEDALQFNVTPLGKCQTIVRIRECVIVPKAHFHVMTGGRYEL